jgi:cell division protein FtsI/penicillin-binding protein 2
LQVTPLQNARWTAAVSTGQLVTPRLGLAIAAQRGSYTGLPRPVPAPLPFAAQLGPVRDGMRAAVTGGTATRLAGLALPAGAKTGTAQDGGLPDGEYDNWISAVAPMNAPEIVMTAWVQGPGKGGNSATSVATDGLRYYADHRAAILATGPVQRP